MDFYCKICERSFDSEEALKMHNDAKHPVEIKKPLVSVSKKTKIQIRNWSIAVGIILLLVIGAVFLANRKSLPPTTIEGHIEVSPPSHILKEPMSITIQKHMLEHADGSGPPGVVINYDCENFECEPDLIPKLEEFAKKYPEFVYVAPFKNMKVKIALTRLNRILTLDSYNEVMIEKFIKSG